MHPSLAYVLAVTVLHFPVAIAETTVFSLIMYFMVRAAAAVR